MTEDAQTELRKQSRAFVFEPDLLRTWDWWCVAIVGVTKIHFITISITAILPT